MTTTEQLTAAKQELDRLGELHYEAKDLCAKRWREWYQQWLTVQELKQAAKHEAGTSGPGSRSGQ